ncbi:hypothetical protein BDR06DRAFT_946647 [Suillus hirtellus]|nr:hypothetical protein BDR06DRAFT_946647 [Suillus hirtellus]
MHKVTPSKRGGYIIMMHKFKPRFRFSPFLFRTAMLVLTSSVLFDYTRILSHPTPF